MICHDFRVINDLDTKADGGEAETRARGVMEAHEPVQFQGAGSSPAGSTASPALLVETDVGDPGQGVPSVTLTLTVTVAIIEV